MKSILSEIKKSIAKAKTAILTTHSDPDGDAIGSVLALGMILEKLGLSVTLYCEDDPPKVYAFLQGIEKIKKELAPLSHYDLAFVVDCSAISRVGVKHDIKQLAPVLINIDHHPDNQHFGNINYVQKTSSVAEEIFDISKYLKIKMNKAMAECLYTAMITDNGNFRYENTTPKTFQIAAELIKAGVSTHELTTRIYDNRSLPALKIAAAAMLDLKITTDHKIAWTTVTEKEMSQFGAKGEDLIGIVDRIRSIEGVEVAIFFREDKGKVKINFRSKEKINVSEIARKYGGGGHAKAAGALIDGPLEHVQEKVISEIKFYLEARKFLV